MPAGRGGRASGGVVTAVRDLGEGPTRPTFQPSRARHGWTPRTSPGPGRPPGREGYPGVVSWRGGRRRRHRRGRARAGGRCGGRVRRGRGREDVPHPHVRLPDERARLGTTGRGPGGRRPGGDGRHGDRRRGGVQHLLHPGERRQQALRPPRQPEDPAREPSRHADRRRWLPGPDGPGEDPRAGRARGRGVRHPQPHRAPELLRRATAEGPIVEILDEPAPVASPPPPTSRPPRSPPSGTSPTPPGSPSRWAATTRAPTASSPPSGGPRCHRPMDDLVAEVAELGPPGGDRGHPARPERELLRPGHHPPPAPLRRPPAGGGRRRRHPPGAIHQPPPEGPPPRDHRGHGRHAGGLQPPAPSPPVRERPHPGGHASGIHGGALPRPPGRRPGRRRRPGRHHRPDRGLPGGDRG